MLRYLLAISLLAAFGCADQPEPPNAITVTSPGAPAASAVDPERNELDAPLRWAALGEPIESSGLRLVLSRSELRAKDGDGTPLLLLWGKIENATADRKIDHISNYNVYAGDDLGNRYRWLPAENGFEAAEWKTTLYPGETTLALWVMERPVPGARTFDVVLSPGAIECPTPSPFRYRIETAKIATR